MSQRQSLIMMKLLKLFSGALLVAASSPALSFGVAVSPTSIQLDGNSQFGHIELSNTSAQARSFAVDFEDPTLASCFKVSPKLINIPAGQTQVVRLQYTCPKESMPAAPMVYFMEQAQEQPKAFAASQLDFRLRLGLKVKFQTNPIQTLF